MHLVLCTGIQSKVDFKSILLDLETIGNNKNLQHLKHKAKLFLSAYKKDILG